MSVDVERRPSPRSETAGAPAPYCAEAGCRAAQLPDHRRCLAHASARARRDFLATLGPASSLDLRGVPIDEELLQTLLAALPDADGRHLPRADFSGATFEEEANLTGVHFTDVQFRGATFRGRVLLGDSHFAGEAAIFARAQFGADVSFDGAVFEHRASFGQARFGGTAWFARAGFREEALFTGSDFQGEAIFDAACWDGGASFEKARFRDRALGRDLQITGALTLDDATFEAPSEIEVSAASISCRGARFVAGVHLKASASEITLAESSLQGSSTVAPRTGAETAPRLVSLEGAVVEDLVLADLDLRACRFADAQHLDRIRLEGQISFANAPRGTRRQTLAEEQEWRHRCAWPKKGWYPAECQGGETARKLLAEDVAILYRSLRKGREDNKDAPGAADFYYGEMEMRRKIPAASGGRGWLNSVGEKLLLGFYWASSGYGLRPSRALICLLVTIIAFVALFHAYGFQDRGQLYASEAEIAKHPVSTTSRTFPPSISELGEAASSFDTWTYCLGTASALAAPSGATLTSEGRLFRTLLRLLGAVLIGLALLSVRGRITR
jgi:uncharacterized protein YjbI with pentapeptide repeats